MQRTVKLPYVSAPEAQALIAHWRRAQSSVVRYSFNRLQEGLSSKEILIKLRQLPAGKLDSWLTLSAITKAKAWYQLNGDKKVVFGGRHNLKLRSEDKLTAEEWQAKRLMPLYYVGHAKSQAEQGGNRRFVLDLEHSRILFYPARGTCFELNLKLGKKSNYSKLLEALQFRCDHYRDTAFTITLTATHVCVSWDQRPERSEITSLKLNQNRVLALDLNPNRIGLAILENQRVIHWTVYDYPELNRKLGKASSHPEVKHQNNKRLFELSQIAKEIQKLAIHYRCGTVVSEALSIKTGDHGKGKPFNRAVNNQWARKGFVQPLLRRLETVGLKHAATNPAYSSKIGNKLWGWELKIPDPACAAVEIGRRFQEDQMQCKRQDDPNLRKEEGQAQTSVWTRGHWQKVWNSLSKSGDTPRFTVQVLKEKFPELCPSQSPFHAPPSRVARVEPARISHGPRALGRVGS